MEFDIMWVYGVLATNFINILRKARLNPWDKNFAIFNELFTTPNLYRSIFITLN